MKATARLVAAAAVSVAAIASACGHAGHAAAGNGLGNTADCTVTLSGAITASYTGCTVGAGRDSAGHNTGFAISVSSATGASPTDSLEIAIELAQNSSATFSTGTYDASNVVNAATVFFHNRSAQSWLQSSHSSAPDQGAFALHISSTGTPSGAEGGTAWLQPAGGFSATLEPQSLSPGASAGAVRVQISFNGGSAPAIPPGTPALRNAGPGSGGLALGGLY